jgi:hypothetical protein
MRSQNPNKINLWLCKSGSRSCKAKELFSACDPGASTQTLKFFFGTDDFDFTIDSKIAGLTNPVRSYASFSQALDCAHAGTIRYSGSKVGKVQPDWP